MIDVKAIIEDRRRVREEDAGRMQFLRRLDEAPFEVTEWEAQFIESFLKAPRNFTPRQREAVDKMREHYQGRL